MDKIKQCLIVIGDIVNPTPMYKNGYKLLYRCGMHFISLTEALYSIFCNEVLKETPDPDEVASLIKCNKSLVHNGEQYINNTNKAVIKYTINEGLQGNIEFMAKNYHNFQAENLTLDTIYLNYDREICKVLPYDCNSALVEDYINKTLSVLNDWNHYGTTCSNNTSAPLQADLWYYNVRHYLMLGAAIVGGIGVGVYAGYHYWSYKSMKEDAFWYQKYLNCIDNLQIQKPQTQRIVESIAPKYLKMDMHEAGTRDRNLEFDPQIYSGNNYISNDQICGAEIRDGNLATNNYPNIQKCINNMQSNTIYRDVCDATTNHEANIYTLPVDENELYNTVAFSDNESYQPTLV